MLTTPVILMLNAPLTPMSNIPRKTPRKLGGAFDTKGVVFEC